MNWIFGEKKNVLFWFWQLTFIIYIQQLMHLDLAMHWHGCTGCGNHQKPFNLPVFQNILNLIISFDLESFGLAFSQVSRVRGNIVAFKWNLKSFIVGLLLLFLNHRVIHAMYNKTQPSSSTEIQVTTIYQGVTGYILSFCHYEEWQKQKKYIRRGDNVFTLSRV